MTNLRRTGTKICSSTTRRSSCQRLKREEMKMRLYKEIVIIC